MDDVLHEWFDTYPRCDAAEEAIGKRLVKIEDGYLILTSKGVSVLDNGSENTSASLPWPLPSPRTPAGVLTASVAQSEELSPGDSFGARFVEKVLGRGGMGVTYLLRDDHGAPIVLKSILPDRLKNIKTIQSLYNEISMLLKIPPHQNITQGRYAGLDNNIPYLFLDYIPGGDLWCVCKEQRRLSTSECWWVLLNIVHGLA